MAKITREELTLNDNIKFDNKGGAILGVLEGPIADYKHPTRNGRIYGERLWENVFKNPLVQEQFANGGIVGELDHPKDREDICSEKIAVLMSEPPVKKNGEYWGKFNILNTPCGKIVYNLAKAGFKLGVSSRGTGDYDEYTGEVDPNNYDFTCFDVVIIPAVKDARMNLVTESLNTEGIPLNKFKKLLTESLSSEDSSEKKNFMVETAKNVLNEAFEKHKCVLCGKEFTGYGNNAEPLAKGLCCDECNDEKVIPERIKQLGFHKDDLTEAKDKDVKDDSKDEEIKDEPEEVKNDIPECPECKEEFDSKLKEFLVDFLKTQGLESDSEEEKDLFVDLFHEKFPNVDCLSCECKDKSDDIDDINNDVDDLAAKDDGADTDNGLLDQFQESLKENKALKEELQKLQVERAVGNSKVEKLNEELEKFKVIAANAGKKAMKSRDYKKENDSLTEKFSKLNEQLNNAIAQIEAQKGITANVEKNYGELVKANKSLTEELNTTKSSSKKLEEKYQKSMKVLEGYKNLAFDIANRYIDNKALALGVTSNEIKNRLNENYTLDDVDKVCEDLQKYSLNIGKLPFPVSNSLESKNVRVKLRESNNKNQILDSLSKYKDEDGIDEELLELAGLRK